MFGSMFSFESSGAEAPAPPNPDDAPGANEGRASITQSQREREEGFVHVETPMDNVGTPTERDAPFGFGPALGTAADRAARSAPTPNTPSDRAHWSPPRGSGSESPPATAGRVPGTGVAVPPTRGSSGTGRGGSGTPASTATPTATAGTPTTAGGTPPANAAGPALATLGQGGGNTSSTGGATQSGAAGLRGDVGRTSGLFAAIERMGARVMEPAHVKKELAWQKAAGANSNEWKSFRDGIYGQQTLRVFAMLPEGATRIALLHSAASFHDPINAPELTGKALAFVGDRNVSQNPVPVYLAPEKPWKWPSIEAVFGDEIAMAAPDHTPQAEIMSD